MFSRTGRLPVRLFLNLFGLQQFFKVCEQRLKFPEGISLVYIKSKVTSYYHVLGASVKSVYSSIFSRLKNLFRCLSCQ